MIHSCIFKHLYGTEREGEEKGRKRKSHNTHTHTYKEDPRNSWPNPFPINLPNRILVRKAISVKPRNFQHVCV